MLPYYYQGYIFVLDIIIMDIFMVQRGRMLQPYYMKNILWYGAVNVGP